MTTATDRLSIHLRIVLPSRVFVDEQVKKVVAEATNGSFCLLPRHIDFVAPLVPSILSYETTTAKEVFTAVDAGVLVKCGREVLVSTERAVTGPDLGQLRRTVAEEFMRIDERERAAQTAVAKLEAQMVRRFLELDHHASR